MTQQIIVVGAGVFGTWTATHLQRAGHAVTLVDAWGPAHARSSSGGESRLTRGAYGRDSIYTRMALDSLAEWKTLSDRCHLPIFIDCGVLFFFGRREPYFEDTLAVHRELGLPTEVLERKALDARFPMFNFDGIGTGLFEPDFGALVAQRAVQSLADEFVRRGGAYRQAMVAPPQADGETLEAIALADGSHVAADAFVFAAGPWLPKLFPEVVGPRIRVTRQEVFLFAPPAGDARFLPARMPGWSDFSGGDMYYGFPDIEGRGVKIAHDVHGVVVDPDTQDRRHGEAALTEVIAYRDRRFPDLRGAPLTEARVCQYENSSNGDFLIDRHPHWSNVLLVGGGSGHGFKHGPEVGRCAAARLFDLGEPEARFALASKSEAHHREVH